MEIRLPIELNTAVITECWVFEKLAMIQASPFGEEWLSTHLHLYMDPTYSCYFGDGETHYPTSYFWDILAFEEIPLFSLAEDELFSLILRRLREGRYIMVMLYHEGQDGGDYFHEALLYGYDDEKEVFFAPQLQSTELVEQALPFDFLRTSLTKLKNYALQVPEDRIRWAKEYQYPVCSIRIRTDYVPNQVYDALMKFIPEIWGKTITITELDRNMQLYGEKTAYKGLGCLFGLKEALQKQIKGEPLPPEFIGFSRNLKKMWEHRQNLLGTMRYVIDRWNIQDEIIYTRTRDYAACCDRFEQWIGMVIKAQITGQTDPYIHILKEIPSVYHDEFFILADFYNHCVSWYTENQTRL